VAGSMFVPGDNSRRLLEKLLSALGGAWKARHALTLLLCVLQMPTARGQTGGCDVYDPVVGLAEHAGLAWDGSFRRRSYDYILHDAEWYSSRAIAVADAVAYASANGLEHALARVEAAETITVECIIWSDFDNFEGSFAADATYPTNARDPRGAGYGGAFYVAPSAAAHISHSSFVGNRVRREVTDEHGNGGALYLDSSASAHISYSSFVGNSAESWGGQCFSKTVLPQIFPTHHSSGMKRFIRIRILQLGRRCVSIPVLLHIFLTLRSLETESMD